MRITFRQISGLLLIISMTFVVAACGGANPPAAEPMATDAPVAMEEPVATDASGCVTVDVPLQTPFACPASSATDASGAPLISGCESTSDIMAKYPDMKVVPNSVMMEYSAEGTREGYYDDTITSGLTDLPTMCNFLQYHGDIYNGDQASLTAIGTGIDILGPICATDSAYTQVAVSDRLTTLATTALGLQSDDKIFAYETAMGLGYYVFWKLDPNDSSRVKVSIISGALSCQ